MPTEKTVTINRAELVALFKEWERRAEAGKWKARVDPEASADFFIELAEARS